MTIQPDLLDYPNSPGWKARATSQAAAEAIAPQVKSLRARVFDEIKRTPSTPEEVAARLKQPVHSIRPRFSECAAKGWIVDSGERRRAMGGRNAIVWRIA